LNPRRNADWEHNNNMPKAVSRFRFILVILLL